MKSAAVCTLISRMAAVLIDTSAITKVFSIALSTQNADHQACIVELLAVCYLIRLSLPVKCNSFVNRWRC